MKRSTRIILSLAGLAIVALVVVVLATTRTPRTGTTVAASSHPTVTAAQTCISCKTPTHQYKHKTPYQGSSCASCHNLESWRRVSYVHRNTAFNVGMHPVLGCSWCHVEGAPLIKPDCSSCHIAKHGGPKECAKCHTASAWSLRAPLPSGHVSLAGGHAGLKCFDCHAKPAFSAKPRSCTTCHGTKHGGLTNCAQCHDPSRGWKPTPGFDHAVFFPLTGRHATLACGKCHPGNRFVGTPTNCVGCHGPKHGGLRNCASCHTTSRFKPSTFRHSRVFVLSGAHKRLACSKCHPNRAFAKLRWSGSGRACVRCHGAKHGGLTKCASCHTTSRFKPSTFRHSTMFVLSGAHARLACSKCHPSGEFARLRWRGSGTACVRCHGAKHGGLTKCASCHTTSSFVPSTFVHSNVFKLSGQHAALACSKCHPNGAYAKLNWTGSGTACVRCHGAQHGGVTNCARCHTTAGFVLISSFAHTPSVPLGGFHASASCSRCHHTTPLNFVSATTPCSSCHTAPHVGPTDCLRCHYPGQSWGSTLHFTHIEMSYHYDALNVGCSDCHTTGNYAVYSCNRCHTPGTVSPYPPYSAQ